MALVHVTGQIVLMVKSDLFFLPIHEVYFHLLDCLLDSLVR